MRRLALFLLALAAPAGAAEHQFGCCTVCGRTCHLKAEPAAEDETCYEVECKEICIPAVRFPWESCRTPKCGRVRLVARLKTESREVKTCKYEWVIACPSCGRKTKPPADAPLPTVPPAPAEGNEKPEGSSEESPAPQEPQPTPPVPPVVRRATPAWALPPASTAAAEPPGRSRTQ